MHKLHDALPLAGQKHNRYCGPAAIAAVTGYTTGQAAKAIRDFNGKPSVRGCTHEDLNGALCSLGWIVSYHRSFYKLPARQRPMLKDFLAQTDSSRAMIIIAGHHYLAFCGDEVVDSLHRVPTNKAEFSKDRSRVAAVFSYIKADTNGTGSA